MTGCALSVNDGKTARGRPCESEAYVLEQPDQVAPPPPRVNLAPDTRANETLDPGAAADMLAFRALIDSRV